MPKPRLPGLLRPVADKMNLHPRNRHTARYDFPSLTKASPELAAFVAKNPYGDLSIDFANPRAVVALNRALLKQFYGVAEWGVPEGYLCPPIPGRADYLHYLADLLASSNGGKIPRGEKIQMLDVGTGASCIYPLVGRAEYGWSFLASDIDEVALENAHQILEGTPELGDFIELRLQENPPNILKGLLKPKEKFDAVLCNPPFHASLEEALAGSRKKWKNLGREPKAGSSAKPVQNFGGQNTELWCPGGEVAFVSRMIREGSELPGQVFWYTSLVSKSASLPELEESLRKARATDVQVIEMSQGQKKSRILAWTFLTVAEQKAWRETFWRPIQNSN